MTYNEILKLPVIENEKFISDLLQQQLNEFPQIKNTSEIPSPNEFKDMEKAVNLFIDAHVNNKRIIFIHDSDFDGMSTYSITWTFFSKYFGYDNLEMVLTKRADGYGFLPMHVDKHPGDLYITFDNGVTASAAVKKAISIGAKVIINDHHQVDPNNWPLCNQEDLDKLAVVDQWQPDCNFPYKDISGAVVCWFFFKALIEKYNLTTRGDWYEDCLSELALSTLADVMPIDRHLSRFFVIDFLINGKIKNTQKPNILAFMKDSDNFSPSAEDFAFGYNPVINATNRMTTAQDGVNFMIANDQNTAKQWWDYIKQINDNRKNLQQKLTDYIIYRYKDYLPTAKNNKKFIMIPGEFYDESRGVLGVIAGRLAEKYKVPCIVLNKSSNGKSYSGSGRSIGNINILGLFRNPLFDKMITHVGGHKAALGIGVKTEFLDDFYNLLLEESSKIDDIEFINKDEAMGFIEAKNISVELYNEINTMEPFGHKFQKPVLCSQVVIKSVTTIGKLKNHLSLIVTDKNEMVSFKALWFFHDFEPKKGDEVYIFFQPSLETFRGNTKLSLKIKNIQSAIPF